ncbi:uncharacterized protein LOC113352048 [Papaver somniferum]|uniref:uncharacterized protein LOC113352048 n=1 Tax=Papaver somniferum TaxID=3469 RepID=UPI000E6F997F|nr:uncharacterized protein LOC113352048 [Papaver somniferum]
MAIKLDLSKAFDILEWSFIIVVFKKLGFSEVWCHLIYQCISTVSYSVLINGSPSESFLPSRGIRQGDCLSPYIFILCMKVLSQLLSKAEEDKLIQDDCMMFCKASVTYAKNIIKVINVFAKASGQAINFDKSGFITSGKMHHKLIKILSKTLNMKFLSSSEKYLGTPLFIGKDKTKSFSFLIDNFYARLNSSKKSNLNIAGRTMVTKHVLSSLSVYHMACFPLPTKVTRKSKLNGGLGIRNSYVTNRVFICKLGWRIMKNQNSLLSRFIQNKYFPNQNLLEIDKAADSSSWLWKGIVKGLKFIKDNTVIKINNGAFTPIWNAPWIPGISLPPTPLNPICNNYTYVSELIDYHHNCWNVPLLNLLFSHDDVIRILSIRLNLLQPDSLKWAHTRDESVMHLFVNCPVVSRIWFGLSLQHLVTTDLEWLDDIFLYWHDSSLGMSPFKVGWPSVGAIVMWCVWKLRCDVIFKNVTLDMNRIIVDIKRMLNSYIAPQISVVVCFDVKIPQSKVEHFMFIDGSFKDFKFGIDVIWCDVAGNVRKTRSDFGLIQDAVGAEATALLLAISWAKEMNLPKVVFVSDCLHLVNFVNGCNSSVDWRSLDLLELCRSSISSSVSFKLMYIKRQNNPLADRLARRARKNNLKGLWFSLPNFLNNMCRKTNLNILCNSLLT